MTASTPPEPDRPERLPVNTRFILCVGMIFVVNSHLKDYWPHPAFGGDGLLGYAIFFFAAGLGIGMSFRHKVRSFPDYYWRRFIRIYPSLWLVMIPVTLIDWYPAPHPVSDYFDNFVYPTKNTFVAPLMLDYIPLYLLLLARKPSWLLWSIAALCIPFAILWSQLWQFGKDIPEAGGTMGVILWRVANFQMMLLGAWFAFHLPSRDAFRRDLILSLVLLAAYVVLKMGFSRDALRGLFPLLFAVIGVQCWLLFRLAASLGVERLMNRSFLFRWAVLLIGGCSLELYFIHNELVVVHWSSFLARLPFPVGILLVWAISLPLSYFVERVASWIRSGCRNFSWKLGVEPG
ncbi:acyltransferase [Sphingomonas sp.]|uniref:acyltransferase family protein n=1 Tax=Sphingomonas sp. TaxID=28214 RepID=UPI001B2197F4|nr:acyltransferase [Sphingomonas sp.]MBO9711486.1 acyltransferase [Sphingomonas sp.]